MKINEVGCLKSVQLGHWIQQALLFIFLFSTALFSHIKEFLIDGCVWKGDNNLPLKNVVFSQQYRENVPEVPGSMPSVIPRGKAYAIGCQIEFTNSFLVSIYNLIMESKNELGLII